MIMMMMIIIIIVIIRGLTLSMTGRELAPDSRSSPRAVVREVEGLRDCISLTCRRSCLSSPFKRKEKFTLFSNHNGSRLRRQAGGFSLHTTPLVGQT